MATDEGGYQPSDLDSLLNAPDSWDAPDIRAVIKAAEDQDPMLEALNKAYDGMWMTLLHNEDLDNDDDHPFHYACEWIQVWRSHKYPNIWPPVDNDEEEVDV